MNENVIDTKSVPLFELDLLRTLVAIAETGSFSAAAEAVFRTPSAVSMQVKRMEEMIGRPLFMRDSRSVTLTADGEALLTHSRRLLALNREMMARFVAPEIAGEVRLGTPDDAAERFLPAMLSRFRECYPGVVINVVVDSSPNLFAKIESGHLDLAILTRAAVSDKDLNIEPVFSEKLVWAAKKCGVASEQRPLPISVWECGCPWRDMGTRALERAGIDYKISFESANISGQRAAILADLVVAPIPVSSLTDEIVAVGNQLPALDTYELCLAITKNTTAPINAAADHLRACFAEREMAV